MPRRAQLPQRPRRPSRPDQTAAAAKPLALCQLVTMARVCGKKGCKLRRRDGMSRSIWPPASARRADALRPARLGRGARRPRPKTPKLSRAAR